MLSGTGGHPSGAGIHPKSAGFRKGAVLIVKSRHTDSNGTVFGDGGDQPGCANFNVGGIAIFCQSHCAAVQSRGIHRRQAKPHFGLFTWSVRNGPLSNETVPCRKRRFSKGNCRDSRRKNDFASSPRLFSGGNGFRSRGNHFHSGRICPGAERKSRVSNSNSLWPAGTASNPVGMASVPNGMVTIPEGIGSRPDAQAGQKPESSLFRLEK